MDKIKSAEVGAARRHDDRAIRPSQEAGGSAATPLSRQARDMSRSPRSARAPGISNASTLERDLTGLEQNAAAGRAVTRRQSAVAAELTNGESSIFDQISEGDEQCPAGEVESQGIRRPGAEGPDATREELDHIVADPINQEQSSDLTPPPGFKPGSNLPQLPSFQDQTPVSTKESPDGTTTTTYRIDGVTYEQVRLADGTLTTNYSEGDVDYQNREKPDGTSSWSLETTDHEGSHSRQISLGADGEVLRDHALSTRSQIDSETRATSYASHSETIENGTNTVTDHVRRPDGGVADTTSTTAADGSVQEVYSYRGPQGEMSRTSHTDAQGNNETTTEKAYSQHVPIEQLVSFEPIPETGGPIAIMPQGLGTGPTQIRSVEVTTSSNGEPPQVQSSSTTYSQTSTDVQPLEGAYPYPVEPNGASLTHTFTVAEGRDENGQLVKTTEGSQAMTIFGTVPGGEPFQATRTDGWSEDGSSSTSFHVDGITEENLTTLNPSDPGNLFQVNVPGMDYPLSLAPPAEGIHPGNGSPDILSVFHNENDAKEWLGADGQFSLEFAVQRDSEGKVIAEAHSFDNRDDDGNGRLVTRTYTADGLSWSYADFTNDGKDYKQQTVFPGGTMSVYEEHRETGPHGQFESTTQTSIAGQVVSTNNASRSEVTEDQLRQYAESGSLSEQQLQRMLRDGPPYFVEQTEERGEDLVGEDGELLRDEDGRPLQTAYTTTSLSVENSDGYSVSKQQHTANQPNSTVQVISTVSTVADPNANNPIQARYSQYSVDTSTGRVASTASNAPLAVSSDGTVILDGTPLLGEDGKPVRIQTGGHSIGELLEAGFEPSSIVSQAGGLAGEVYEKALNSGKPIPLSVFSLELFAEAGKAFDRFAGVVNIFTGKGWEKVEGAGQLLGTMEATAESALGRLSARGVGWAEKLLSKGIAGKALGALGGAIDTVKGVVNMFEANNGKEMAAAGLETLAGGIAIYSSFLGPAGMIGGFLVGGCLQILSMALMAEFPKADLDPRMSQPGFPLQES